MALLDRYRRKGGFETLLKLIESSTPSKKESLLKLIHEEDESWAKMIEMKCLTMDKIFSWDVAYIKDIIFNMEPRVLGISLIGQDTSVHDKVASCLTEIKWIEVADYLGDTHSDGEIHAAQNQVIQTTRTLEEEGYIRFQDIDPSLVLLAA